MGDDILEAEIQFGQHLRDVDLRNERMGRITSRINMILKEHQYKRLGFILAHGGGNKLHIRYLLPDSDGDPDRFHRCGLEVAFERIQHLLLQQLGPPGWETWEFYTDVRLP